MKKYLLMFCILLLSIGVAYGQLEQVINTFDAASADTNYWNWFETVNSNATIGGHYHTNDNANQDTGWVKISHVSDPVMIGSGAMQLEYSVHNTEGWGGFSTIQHWHPDTNSVYDWSAYDSISFWYYNSVPQDSLGRVGLRLNLHEVSDSPDGNATYDVDQCEYYYSFYYVLDNAPGWNEIKLPLVSNDSWDGNGFNLTGWAGVLGNAFLDRDKIKGFSIEFSISGSGNGDFSSGTIVLDHMALKGPSSVELVFFNGRNIPGNVEIWSGWGGGSYEVTDEEAYTPGTNSIKWNTPPNDWAVWDGLVFTLSSPKNLFVNWSKDSFKLKIKADAGLGPLKLVLSDNDEDGFHPDADGRDTTDLEFEAGYMIEETAVPGGGYDGTWKVIEVPLRDFNRFEAGWNGVDMTPGEMDSTKVNKFKILIASGDGVGKIAYLDEIWTGNPVIDVIPPEAPTGISAVQSSYYNLVVWADVADEAEESYNVYASEEPITDIDAPEVELIASGVPENTQSAIHYIFYPLVDNDVTFYYAVSCKDAGGNVGEPGTSAPITNLAQGIPTISLNPPANFAADGDLAEWEASGIMPFVLKPTTNHVPAGSVTDDADLTATVYFAVDDDYLYVAADVVDDVYSYGAGNWWDQDAFQIFIGLYDGRGSKHQSLERGSEPDYIMYMVEDKLQHDNGGYTIYTPADADYYFEGFNPDYVTEAKIPLDSIAFGDDVRFHPERGMRIPIDIYFHDNDGDWDGNLGFSPYSTDHQWQTPTEWAHTWIGDTTHTVGIDNNDASVVVNKYSLSQNYPNPFNPTTTIDYSLAKPGLVRIELYNMLGQKVETVVNENKIAGHYTVNWNAKGMSSGIYFYRIQSGDFIKTRKMLLVK
jgi:hypothetical protein